MKTAIANNLAEVPIPGEAVVENKITNTFYICDHNGRVAGAMNLGLPIQDEDMENFVKECRLRYHDLDKDKLPNVSDLLRGSRELWELIHGLNN